MDTKADRIRAAKRAGLVARMESSIGPERAEAVMAGWEAEAERVGVGPERTAYWSGAEVWVAAALVRRPRAA